MLIRRANAAALVVTAAVACAIVSPSGADAASTIGNSYEYTDQPFGCVPNDTFIQTASPGNAWAAPHDGVITSWSNRASIWGKMTFKVARLSSGSNYTMLASDGPRTATFQGGSLTTYPIRIPVRQGDVIGAKGPGASTTCTASGGTVGVDADDVAPGSSGFFDSTAGVLVPIQASLEHDRDNDGYGDETQDGCPTNAATQGVCPLPTTIGRVIATAPDGSCGGYTYIPVEPRDFRYTVPADGVLTSWSSSPSGSGGTIRLKTMRPQEGGQYVTVAQDPPRVPTLLGANTFKTRIPVRQGDRIALAVTGDLNCLNSVSSGLTLQTAGDPPIGSSSSFTERSRALSLAAAVEADADNDGYGDTTQDRCPTNASTQAACPVKPPPPPVDAACEKAKAKLSKAKAKLAKLKKNDAPAKKVKKAKKAVKKAKGKVNKAC